MPPRAPCALGRPCRLASMWPSTRLLCSTVSGALHLRVRGVPCSAANAGWDEMPHAKRLLACVHAGFEWGAGSDLPAMPCSICLVVLLQPPWRWLAASLWSPPES